MSARVRGRTGPAAALAAAALVMAAAVPARAQTITIEAPWARATAPGAGVGAVYFTIVDHGAPDRLIGATTPAAASAQVHEMAMQGNVMRMRAVEALPVSSQAPVKLSPGGYHLMLMGLKAPLKRGQTIPVTLTFAQAGAIAIAVPVEGMGARGPAGGPNSGHDMSMPMDMTMPPAK